MKLLLAGTAATGKVGRGAAPLVAALLLGALVALPAAPAQAQISPKTRESLAKLAQPWPDAEGMRARRTDAENRRLFQSSEPLTFTLTADFKTVNNDRDENSTKRYPATLTVTGGAATTVSVPVKLGTRGHFRLRKTSCSFVPLRVEFSQKEVAGTVFDRQGALKLVTHCQNTGEYDQYTLREYLVYRILNLLTPRSFRARLAKATYVDAASGKPLATRYAMFIEDDDDVARRMDGRVVELPRALFKDLDSETLTLMALFEYMIANTDLSIIMLHNVRLVQDEKRVLYSVPYDFDLAGLVDTHYAIVDRNLGIKTVRERLYRGPCRSGDELEPVLEKFRAKKGEVMALYDSLPDLESSYRRGAKEYLEEFYGLISRKDRVQKVLVDGCKRAPGM
jgi:hypothetical protein